MRVRPSAYLDSSKWINSLRCAVDWENGFSYLVKWIIEVGYIWICFVSLLVQHVGREKNLGDKFISSELKMALAPRFHFGLLQLFLEYLWLMRCWSFRQMITEVNPSLHCLMGNELSQRTHTYFKNEFHFVPSLWASMQFHSNLHLLIWKILFSILY